MKTKSRRNGIKTKQNTVHFVCTYCTLYVFVVFFNAKVLCAKNFRQLIFLLSQTFYKMDLYGDLPPTSGGSGGMGSVAIGHGWARPNASLVPKRNAPAVADNKSSTSSAVPIDPQGIGKQSSVSAPPVPSSKTTFSSVAFKPRQAPSSISMSHNNNTASIQTVPKSEKQINISSSKSMADDNFDLVASFEAPDPYDPSKPNDYLAWCEERLERKRRARLEEENRHTLEQLERERVAIERERAAAAEKGDVQKLKETMSVGRGRGRGLSNLPAWMTATEAASNDTTHRPTEPTNNKRQYEDVDESSDKSIASRLMSKMGYEEGSGLGRQGQGITKPIEHRKTSAGAAHGTIELAPEDKQRLSNLNNNESNAKKRTGLFSNPSCVLLLMNMVGPDDPINDLAEETKGECEKYGAVRRCEVRESKSAKCRPEDRVRTFVAFERQESAIKAFRDLNGRYFGGRQIGVTFFDEKKFDRGELDDNT